MTYNAHGKPQCDVNSMANHSVLSTSSRQYHLPRVHPQITDILLVYFGLHMHHVTQVETIREKKCGRENRTDYQVTN